MDVWLPYIALWLSSAFGAAVYVFMRPASGQRFGGIINLAIGTGTGAIFAPLICEWQGWPGTHSLGGTGCVLGFLGVTMFRAVLDSAESDGAKTLVFYAKNWLRRTFGMQQRNEDGTPKSDSWNRDDR
jgi:hypothetical protein